jgi:hypothetical protein
MGDTMDAGHRMHTPCARFPARSSVLGVRSSALIRSRVPGARHPGLGLVSGFRSPAWTKGEGRSHLPSSPQVSMAEGRIPRTEPGCRKTHPSGLHPYPAYPVCGFLKTSAWYRVPGPGYLGLGTESTPRAGHRAPKTEPGTGKRAHRVCILHRASCILPHPIKDG